MESGNILYANDLCSAFLAEIVQLFAEIHPDKYLGRTAMQKLAYFSKVLGVPIPCSFGIYTYGPYSDKVKFSVESLLADEVIVDSSAEPATYSNYRPAGNLKELLRLYSADLAPHEDRIRRTVRTLGGFKPNELELIATLHFIGEKQLHTRGSVTQTSVIAEFKSIKKDKFQDHEINGWYGALVESGLIETAAPAAR